MFVKTALTRQIAEAVWIQRWGEDIVLNSKAEFNRCTISRLTIGEEDRPSKTNKDPQGPGEEVGEEVEGEQEIQEWVVERTTTRRAQEIIETDSLRRGVCRDLEEWSLRSPLQLRSPRGNTPYWRLTGERRSV